MKIFVTLTVIIVTIGATPHVHAQDDANMLFEQFIKAQNQHDLHALSNLLIDKSDFLWITKGQAIWGKEAALKRFESLYKGIWNLEPDKNNLKIMTVDKNTRQLFVPITFLIGESGKEPQQVKFLMNMMMVKESGKWKVSSILPIQTM